MLLTEEVKVKINARNHRHYKELGYQNVKNNNIILVKVEDLTSSSSVEVEVQCDYCKDIKKIKYSNYTKNKKESYGYKDSCSKCKTKKTKETNLEKYGVESNFSTSECREIIKQTMIKKYGVDHHMKNKQIKEKQKELFLDKYGVSNPFQIPEAQEKQRETNLKKYGVENVFANERIQGKISDTLLKKYQVDNPMKNIDIAKKSFRNSILKKQLNNSQTSSSQQRYLHSLFGGEINYPVDLLSLDIAFPEDKVYIEYDGSGHDIQVKYKKITEEEFRIKEIKRYKFLKNLGWKQIQIISRKDKIPNDETLKQMKKDGFDILFNGVSNWVKYDIDNKTMSYKGSTTPYDFNLV